MANEITSQLSFSYAKGNDSFRISIDQKQNVSSGIRVSQVQIIGTTYEALSLGDVGTDGGAFFARNLDATNYVEIGREISAAFQAFVKLKPGEFCFISGLSSRSLYAKANTAATNLLYGIWNP